MKHMPSRNSSVSMRRSRLSDDNDGKEEEDGSKKRVVHSVDDDGMSDD